MLTIELRFPSGRYHANPWGRNVNEGEVEWPPSPYRLARALIDVWKRRKPEWPEEKILPILKSLSSPVRFFLPSATAAHTRSFLSSNERDSSSKQLIFDAFVALEHDEKCFIGLDSGEASAIVEDLNALLCELNYLGRSESWISARVLDNHSQIEWNCFPKDSCPSGFMGEDTRVACLGSPLEYSQSASETWLDAICFTSTDLLRDGWSDPPAVKWINYLRRRDSFAIRPERQKPARQRFRCAKYALVSTVLPRAHETVPLAERVRTKLMGIHKRIKNEDLSLVSPVFSGKTSDGNPLTGHRHAYYLSLDEDGDGYLDHLLVYASVPFDESELSALDALHSVWQPNRRPDINFVLISLSEEIFSSRSKEWISATPFVTSRHYRKGRGAYDDWLKEEIVKECGFHGLPAPAEIIWIPHTMHTSHSVHWVEFIRSRKNQTPLQGYGCILRFSEEVAGPFALGAGCHFGLGIFVPYKED